jgi:hypothetical protein
VSFEAYIRNIQTKTGKLPEDFYAMATERGLLDGTPRAMQIVAWLKQDFGLGHGHAMAIWCAFQKNGWVGSG